MSKYEHGKWTGLVAIFATWAKEMMKATNEEVVECAERILTRINWGNNIENSDDDRKRWFLAMKKYGKQLPKGDWKFPEISNQKFIPKVQKVWDKQINPILEKYYAQLWELEVKIGESAYKPTMWLDMRVSHAVKDKTTKKVLKAAQVFQHDKDSFIKTKIESQESAWAKHYENGVWLGTFKNWLKVRKFVEN